MRVAAVLLVLVACTEQGQHPPFKLRVHQEIDDSVTRVVIDGEEHAFHMVPGFKSYDLIAEYNDYGQARASAPFTIEIYAGDTLRRQGSVVAGACFAVCGMLSACAELDDLRAEDALFDRDTDLVAFDQRQVRCVFDDSTKIFNK